MRPRNRRGARIGVLALGTFVIGTDGFVIAGVLPGIAHDLHASLSDAGLLVTAFAIAYAAGAPLLTTVAGGRGRRRVLVVGMSVLALANGAGALAPGYRWLLAARVLAALAGGLYSPIALAAAVEVSGPSERARAMAVVLGGLTISLVIGVPLGSLLGDLGSWRWTFGFVAVLAAAAACGIRALLPSLPAAPRASLAVRVALLRRPAVVANLAASFLWITGAFTVYTFIVPVFAAATGWHGAGISALLVVYGAAAFAGNHVGGFGADRWGARRMITVALVVVVVSLAVLAYAAHTGPHRGVVVAIIGVVGWAGAGWSLTPAQSRRLVELTPSVGPEVLSLNTSAIYFGIAAGAALGGRVLAHFGVVQLGLVGAVLEAAAFLVVALAPDAVTSPADDPVPLSVLHVSP